MSSPVVIPQTPLVKHLFTTIRDKTSTRHDFVWASRRIVRLLVEEAVSLLPTTPVTVETPCARSTSRRPRRAREPADAPLRADPRFRPCSRAGGTFEGCRLPKESSICAVSILRAADCMLEEVRMVMPSCAVGKILIQRNEKTAEPVLMYSKLPPDVASRPILLLDPMLATGGSAVTAVKVLVERGCKPESIVFVNVLCVAEGLDALAKAYPSVRVVTGGIDPILDERKYIVPGLGDFGDRYFGTDGLE